MKDTAIIRRSLLKYIFLPISASILVMTALHFGTGIYWEEYEPLVNQFFSGKYTERPYREWLTDNHFLLHPLYAHIERLLPGIQIYSWVNLFLATGITAIYLSLSLKVARHHPTIIRVLVMLLILALLYDSLILVNNVRWSILLSGAAFISIIVFPRHYILSLFFLLLSFLVRVEMPLLFSSLALISGILLFKNTLRYRLILPSLGLFLAYGIYLFLLKTDVYRWEVYKYERSYNERNIVPEYQLDSALGTEKGAGVYKAIAIRYFVRDDQIIQLSDYGKIVPDTKSVFLSLSTKEIFSLVLSKTEMLYQRFLSYSPYHLLLISLLLLIMLFLSLYGKTAMVFKKILFLLLIISVPLCLNFFTYVPERVFLPFYTTVIIGFLLFFLHLIRKIRLVASIIMICLTLMGISRNVHHTKNILEHFSQYEKNYVIFAQKISSLNKNNQTVFLSNGSDLPMFPVRLFAEDLVFQVIFVDMFMFTYYHCFEERAQQIFGTDFSNLQARIKEIASKKALFVSTPEYNEFLRNYLIHFHNTVINFEQHGHFIEGFDEITYTIHLEENDSTL